MNAKPVFFYFTLAVLVALQLVGSTIHFSHDAAGRLVSADYGTNRTISYAYDNAGNLLQTSQPAPGLHIVAVVGGQFTLSWPAAPGGFVLEASSSVGPGAIWTRINLSPIANGNLLTVTIPVGNTTAFYRLQQP